MGKMPIKNENYNGVMVKLRIWHVHHEQPIDSFQLMIGILTKVFLMSRERRHNKVLKIHLEIGYLILMMMMMMIVITIIIIIRIANKYDCRMTQRFCLLMEKIQ